MASTEKILPSTFSSEIVLHWSAIEVSSFAKKEPSGFLLFTVCRGFPKVHFSGP